MIGLLQACNSSKSQDPDPVSQSKEKLWRDPKISLPTRVGNNSHTLIDNIFTNNKDIDECSSILLCDISDHLPACVITKPLVCKKKMHKYITISNNSAIAFNNFQNEIKK